jgi:hypothetical protein
MPSDRSPTRRTDPSLALLSTHSGTRPAQEARLKGRAPEVPNCLCHQDRGMCDDQSRSDRARPTDRSGTAMPSTGSSTQAAHTSRQYLCVVHLAPRLHDPKAWTERETALAANHFERLQEATRQGKIILPAAPRSHLTSLSASSPSRRPATKPPTSSFNLTRPLPQES